jgi:hypothetical protein
MVSLGQILAGLVKLIKPLMAFFIYLAGKRAARTEIAAEQAKQDAALAQDYLDNRSTDRTPDDTLGRMQDGSF